MNIYHQTWPERMMRIAHETAICCNPHNSSDWDSVVTRQLRSSLTNKCTIY